MSGGENLNSAVSLVRLSFRKKRRTFPSDFAFSGGGSSFKVFFIVDFFVLFIYFCKQTEKKKYDYEKRGKKWERMGKGRDWSARGRGGGGSEKKCFLFFVFFCRRRR